MKTDIVMNVGRVLLQFPDGENVSSGGIFLPPTSELPGVREAKVVSVGDSRVDSEGNDTSIDFMVGDTVLVDKSHAQCKIKVDGKELYVFRHEDVVARMPGSGD